MATVMNINHFSIYLKRNMECTVILPSDMKMMRASCIMVISWKQW